MPVSADKRHRQAAFQPKLCLSVLNIMPLAPKTAPSGRLLNKTALVGPETDFINRLFPLIRERDNFNQPFVPPTRYFVRCAIERMYRPQGRVKGHLTVRLLRSICHTSHIIHITRSNGLTQFSWVDIKSFIRLNGKFVIYGQLYFSFYKMAYFVTFCT